MDALEERTLLLDYYGDLLTPRQRLCFDMRYNQDLSLGEIAEELGVSRQGVYDTLNRAESVMRNMEAKTGCIANSVRCRRVCMELEQIASELSDFSDARMQSLSARVRSAVQALEE